MTNHAPIPSGERPAAPANVTQYLSDYLLNPGPRFAAGDLIDFETAHGLRHCVLIFAIDGDRVEAAFWDGLPNFFETTINELSALRVLKVDRFSQEDLDMYLQMRAAA